LALSNVPAGVYRVSVGAGVGAQPASGALVVRAGTTPLPLATLEFSDLAAGGLDTQIRLPVAVRSLIVDAAADTRGAIGAVALQPIMPFFLERSLGWAHGTAVRAARYDAADAYFMDDNAFAEPQGFWVAGGHRARVVVAGGVEPRRLLLRNAPVENLVRIEVDDGAYRQELCLRPAEETTIALPHTNADDVVVAIRSAHGFRPAQVDPGSGDTRYLGCWVELVRQ
jgi:hypothetical protein